jgi:hypothetical protein
MPNAHPFEDYLTTTDAAAVLGIHPERLRQHARAGDIAPAGTVGRTQLWERDAVEGLLKIRELRGYRVPAAAAGAAGGTVTVGAA